MAIYELKKYHHRKAYRNGDLEAENVIVDVKTYTARKDANAYLINEEKRYKNIGYKTRISIVGKGDKPSELSVYTGHTWVHENTGDEHEECYFYIVNKK